MGTADGNDLPQEDVHSQPSAASVFAVIPAAGRSRRMGEPKLLLELGERTVIRRLLDVLNVPSIVARVVVVRADDESLAREVANCGATLVQPEIAPPDMRDSVAVAVCEIAARYKPAPDSGWMLVPADHPVLDRGVVEQLLDHWQCCQASILVPRFGNRRGHPTILRWRLAEEIECIPANCGVNWLLDKYQDDVEELPLDSPSIVLDLDTPEDYLRLRTQFESQAEHGSHL